MSFLYKIKEVIIILIIYVFEIVVGLWAGDVSLCELYATRHCEVLARRHVELDITGGW